MPSPDELTTAAERKRQLAAQLRRSAPGMSLPQDRRMLLEEAAQLEREADRLDAEARRLSEEQGNR